MRFICGRITDQEDAELDETSSLISPEADLKLNPDEVLSLDEGQDPLINRIAKELVIYYKRNDQLK
jgi:hypothetical protein